MKPNDILFLMNDLYDKIPIHSDVKVKIPHSFSKRFPKNALQLSNEKMNKVFNKFLPEIEEAHHCKILSPKFLNWFLQQNQKYHLESGFGNHDGFLKIEHENEYSFIHKGKKYMKIHGAAFSFDDVAFLASLNGGGSIGADLVTITGGSNGNFPSDSFFAFRLPNGNVTDLYDQVSINIVSTTGNVKLAIYDDNSDAPVNLYASDGGNAQASGYTARSVTEFALATVVNWAAFNADTTMNTKFATGSSNQQYKVVETYATSFGDPAPTGATRGTATAEMTVGHS